MSLLALMRNEKTIGGEVVISYLKKFPDVPTLTLAKKIYKENSLLFKDVEQCRGVIRYYRGQRGSRNRELIKEKTMFKEAGSRNPFNLPISHAEDYTPYVIDQSRTLIISDLHFPYQDNEAIELALNYGLEKDVNCILLNGDVIDFATVSRFDKDWRSRSLKEEFDAVRMFFKSLREHFPKAKIVYKLGNHDERFAKYLFAKAPEIFDCTEFQLEILLHLGEFKIDMVKDKKPISIGKLNVLHGHELVGQGGVNPSRATFTKTLDNTLVGHYHRTSETTETTFGGNIINVKSMGCLCGLHPMFMPVNKWNLGFAFCELNLKTGEYELENLKIIKGKIYK